MVSISIIWLCHSYPSQFPFFSVFFTLFFTDIHIWRLFPPSFHFLLYLPPPTNTSQRVYIWTWWVSYHTSDPIEHKNCIKQRETTRWLSICRLPVPAPRASLPRCQPGVRRVKMTQPRNIRTDNGGLNWIRLPRSDSRIADDIGRSRGSSNYVCCWWQERLFGNLVSTSGRRSLYQIEIHTFLTLPKILLHSFHSHFNKEFLYH